MKRFLLPLAIFLPVLCAASASAQFATIRIGAPVNPVAGLPKLFPSPLTGPLAGAGISLPGAVPALTPSLKLPAPAPFAGEIAPIILPAREGQIPSTPARRSRENVINPLQRVMPGVVIRFAGAPAKPAAGNTDAAREALDFTFDGSGRPVRPSVLRAPVAPSRRVTIPELDLERELGI
ncbi:MAG: hypothetical protein ACHQ49_10275 [Elusimicrobiota bacterium]